MRRYCLTVLFLCLSHASVVSAFQIGTPITSSTPITKFDSGSPMMNGNFLNQKPIVLMTINMSLDERKHFLAGLTSKRKPYISISKSLSELPDQVELGMNTVPVLDQGRHGTCVTFAVTAAVDALIDRGDYVSQLCSLELGQYLEPRSYVLSGWYGSYGTVVINTLLMHGYVKKSDQIRKGCVGVYEYPDKDMNTIGKEMPLEEYHKLSKSMGKFVSVPLMTLAERLEWTEETGEQNSTVILNKVKSELAKRDAKYNLRITVGVMLPYLLCHYNGACGTYHKESDTWVITQAVEKEAMSNPLFEMGGHEMVITGYNDNAVAMDNEGKSHKGLLTLRNSWGAEAGDKGNFYMSYDFFKYLTTEVEEITFLDKSE